MRLTEGFIMPGGVTMEKSEIIRIRNTQKEFFNTKRTLKVRYRISALRTLKLSIERHNDEICRALHEDLGKSSTESYMCEIGMVLHEINYMIRKTPAFAAPKPVHTPLVQFAASSYIKASPLGTVLIMSPWNYPFLLTMGPLVDAIAAGNTAMVKPSAYSPATSGIVKEILEECFPERYVAVVTGGRAENQYLLDQQFDHIFFTGSKTVGKLVMTKAAEHLTPFILELGGKSPCIVDKTANIKLAARRIVFGKLLNCGQTCVAPDYIYCHESVRDQLADAIVDEIIRQYTSDAISNPDYGKIINEKHYNRIMGLISEEKTIFGGEGDKDKLKINPTVMTKVTWDDPVMQEEIFGPLIPVLTFTDVDEAIETINSHPHPLALYVFTESKKTARRFLNECQFGGGCVNDTIIHLASTSLPFGGVGESGMGSYHGYNGFKAFSHFKGIVDKKTWMDMPIRYQPYSKGAEILLKIFMR